MEPNAEIVLQHWLKDVDGLPVNQIGTTIPKNNEDFAEHGFVQIRSVGGQQDNETGMNRSVLRVDTVGYNADGNKLPWHKVFNLATAIKEGMKDSARTVTLPHGYDPARVFMVECLSDPQRIVGDSGLAKYRMRLRVHWVGVEGE